MHMKRYKLITKTLCTALCALLMAGALAGCTAPVDIEKDGAASAVIQDFPVVVNDVTISSKPQKVAVLSGSLADIVLAMGYEDSLVIASDDSTQTELNALKKVPANEIQAIVDAGADLVLADNLSEDQIQGFQSAKITAITIAPAVDRADFELMYTKVGSVLNGASTGYGVGLSAAQKIFTTLDDLARIIPQSDTVITGCILTDAQSGAVTGDMLGNTILTYSGITNVFKGAKGGSYDFEQLKVTDPNFIFCPEGTKAEIEKNTQFAKLTAVKEKKIYEVPMSYIKWEGGTLASAAMHFAGLAYPELLKESSTAVTLPSVIEDDKETSDAKALVSEASKAATESGKTESTESKAEESSKAVEYKALNPEDTNDDVMKMQKRLSELGYLAEEYDGYYGSVTEAAVKAFQKAGGIKETGKADAKTLAALYAKDAPKAAAG